MQSLEVTLNLIDSYKRCRGASIACGSFIMALMERIQGSGVGLLTCQVKSDQVSDPISKHLILKVVINLLIVN